ncbi:HAD hydrolase family protein [Pseudodesulfovibrio sediminis]|uniref:3-deoxy-D-manno-octulosonate 8-phosphate phosphatase KdsC n=1 Tax=Pseudodesulfovibrio sediminis TaxID=2810563 RepID=A0ABN6ERI7_9BACT|nr:HAD hydrolase family protein [Pseudodesulfovibrio sediminis]BCS89003.1 hypothetical protein PSDVSF_22450 [Pseudodesulfovibrio sediminis]
MAVYPSVTLLVRDVKTSALFYENALGFTHVNDGLLLGAFGQSLRLMEGRDTVAGGCVILTFEVSNVLKIVDKILSHGGGRAEKLIGHEPLYLGLDGEVIALRERGIPGAERVKLIVYDFDGVMTDNTVTVDQDGHEAVRANRSDGLGVGLIRTLGVEQVILSTETNPVVRARAEKIGLEAFHGVSDKGAALQELAARRDIAIGDVLYVGNDTNDLEAMNLAGFTVAPHDAHSAILALADFVTTASGGHGVIRELADVLISARK